MADPTGPNPSHRDIQRNVNRNTNQQVQSIRKLVQGVPPGVDGPHNLDGTVDEHISTTNINSKQTTELKNEKRQQISIFQLLINSVNEIKLLLNKIITTQNDKQNQKSTFSLDLTQFNVLTGNFSKSLVDGIAKPLTGYLNGIDTTTRALNSKFSGTAIPISLDQTSISNLADKLSTTFNATFTDIDVTSAIASKIKEVNFNDVLTGKLTGTVDVNSLFTDKIKETDLTSTLNDKIKFNSLQFSTTLNNQLTGLFDGVNKKLKEIEIAKLDLNDKIDTNALNLALQKSLSSIKVENVDLNEALAGAVKLINLDLNDKVKVKDILLKTTGGDKLQGQQKVDLFDITTALNEIKSAINTLNNNLSKSSLNGGEDGEEKGGKALNIGNLIKNINDLISGIYQSISESNTKLSSDLENIKSSLDSIEKKTSGEKSKDYTSSFTILYSELKETQLQVNKNVSAIEEKVGKSVKDIFDKEDSLFYKNLKTTFDDSLNEKLLKITPSEETGSKKLPEYTFVDETLTNDKSITVKPEDVETALEPEENIAQEPTISDKIANLAITINNIPPVEEEPLKAQAEILPYFYENKDLEKLTNLVSSVSENTKAINQKLDSISETQQASLKKDNNITILNKMGDNKKLYETLNNIDDKFDRLDYNRPTITSKDNKIGLRSNMSDVFKALGGKLKQNKYFDFNKFASNFKKSGPLSVVSNLFDKGKNQQQKQPYSLEGYLTSHGKYNTLLLVLGNKVSKGLKGLGNSLSLLSFGSGEGKNITVDGMMGGKGGLDISQITDKLGGDKGLDISQITDKLGDLKNLKDLKGLKDMKGMKGLGKSAGGLGKAGGAAAGGAGALGTAGAIAGGALVAGVAAAGLYGATQASKWDDLIGNTAGLSMTGSQAADGALASINHYLGEGAWSRMKTAWRSGSISKLWGANNLLDNEYTEAEHKALLSLGKDKADELKRKRQTAIIQKRIDLANSTNVYGYGLLRVGTINNILQSQITRQVGNQDLLRNKGNYKFDDKSKQQLSTIADTSEKARKMTKLSMKLNSKSAVNATGEQFAKGLAKQVEGVDDEIKDAMVAVNNAVMRGKEYLNDGIIDEDTFNNLPETAKLASNIKAANEGKLGDNRDFLNSLSDDLLIDWKGKLESEHESLSKNDDSYFDYLQSYLRTVEGHFGKDSITPVAFKSKLLYPYKQNILWPINQELTNRIKDQITQREQLRLQNKIINTAKATEMVQEEQNKSAPVADQLPPASTQSSSGAENMTATANASIKNEANFKGFSAAPETKKSETSTLTEQSSLYHTAPQKEESNSGPSFNVTLKDTPDAIPQFGGNK